MTTMTMDVMDLRELTDDEVGLVSGGLDAGYIYAGMGLIVLGGLTVFAAPAIGGLLAGATLFGYSASALAAFGITASGLTIAAAGSVYMNMGFVS